MSEKISKTREKTQAIVKAKDELITIPECVRTFTSLTISPDISEERLNKIGKFLVQMKRTGAIQFWLGDWCNFCEDNGRALSFLDHLYHHYCDRSIKNIAWVCRQVEPARRRDNLSFAHYQNVAPLPPEEQELWLKDAERMGWGVKELRRRISDERLLAEKNEHKKETGDEYYPSFGTHDNAYNYLEYIDLCNKSVKSLVRNIRRLNEAKTGAAWHSKVSPKRCETPNERNFVKNCSRLFWELEYLMEGHLSKLSLLSENGLLHRPLLFEDVCNEYPSFYLLSGILECTPWKKRKELSDLPEHYQYECLFARCRKLAVLLNSEMRDLTKNFDKFFKAYDELYHEEDSWCSEEMNKFHAEKFLKEHVDAFRMTCYALILHQLDLFKVINSYVPEPPDETTVEKMKAQLFDSGPEDGEKKSKVDDKVKELLNLVLNAGME